MCFLEVVGFGVGCGYCYFIVFFVVFCVMVVKFQNSSDRVKMLLEIVKMNLILYSIFYVFCVLKMEKKDILNDRNKNGYYFLQKGSSFVQGKFFYKGE